MSTVSVDFHLIVGQRLRGDNKYTDGKPSVRVSKGMPTLDKTEIAILMHVDLPLALFRRPRLTASLVVPDDSAPVVITPELESNITRVLQEQLGITLRIEAPAAPVSQEAAP